MRPTVSQYAQALEELSREADPKAKDIAKNFSGFLKRRGESARLPAILGRLEQLAQVQGKRLDVTVVTAHPATAPLKETLEKLAAKTFPGYVLEFHYEIDERVIGGARFRTEEALYDITLGAGLRELKKVMSK